MNETKKKQTKKISEPKPEILLTRTWFGEINMISIGIWSVFGIRWVDNLIP